MIIAIDYDKTYTLDPDLWNAFILKAQQRGHKVICVTNRDNSKELSEPVLNSIGKYCQIIFAGSKWKRESAKEAGWMVDVWIDDMPEMIGSSLLLGTNNGQDSFH